VTRRFVRQLVTGPLLAGLMMVPSAASAGQAAALAAPARTEAVSAADLKTAIDSLGVFEHDKRSKAAQTVRRATPNAAVPALVDAAGGHADGYVRYRALVLLTGFNDPRTADAMRQALEDPNDRLRGVAYKYFEHAPDPVLAPKLLQALGKEESEFVRPQLIRALAALADKDPKARAALVADVDRGMDFFRATVIEALGDYHAAYAVDALTRTAKLDGPLQDDAALALGKVGDKRALETLAALQRSAPRTSQPTIAAAICLLGVNCASHLNFLDQTIRFATDNPGYQTLVRTAGAGLGAVAASGNVDALNLMLDIGVTSTDPVRASLALALGTVALRNPLLLLDVLEKRKDRDGVLAMLLESFDMLDEDFEEERFYVTVRRAYWQASESSPRRDVTQAVIRKLEF
jgi:HEAT repeat protein